MFLEYPQTAMQAESSREKCFKLGKDAKPEYLK